MVKKIGLFLLVWLFLSSCSLITKNPLKNSIAPDAVIPLTGGSKPSARMWSSLVYHLPSGQVILFGGDRLSDLWALNLARQRWVQLSPVNAPHLQRLGGAGAVYDSRVDQLIAFFYTGSGLPGETWAYDFQKDRWRNLSPENAPLSRRFTTLVYDSESDRILMFGGVTSDDSSRPSDETWAYDYHSNRWALMNPSVHPPAAYFLHAVYASKMDRMIVWGGRPNARENAVWSYDYNHNTWQKRVYQSGPKLDSDGAMAYASELNQVFLYIGDQFWSYDPVTNTWQRLPEVNGIGKQYGAALGNDPRSHNLVLFGTDGEAQTWFYQIEKHIWSVLQQNTTAS